MKLALRIYFFAILALVVLPVEARQAQSEELLYRSGDTLYLANADTGKSVELAGLSASASPNWYWSPDGHYLLGNFGPSATREKSIHIYDVDQQTWAQTIPVEENVGAPFWSSDSAQIAYPNYIREGNDINHAELWIINLKTMARRKVYQTPDIPGNIITDTGLWYVWWSPDNQYLLAEEYYATMAYPLVGLVLISADGKFSRTVDTLIDGKLATPIWSPDSKWFLLNSRDPFYIPFDASDPGDVLLYGIHGQLYNLTFTPKVQERNETWSPDGKQIWFDTDTQFVSIELQAVLNFSFHNPSTIEQTVSPLPPKRQPVGEGEEILSPDGKRIVFVLHKADNTSNLVVGWSDGSHTIPIAASVEFLGWRPS